MHPFSVIIITKNEEGNLPVLLASIKKQTVQPAEVIVSDAQSTDKTRKIAKDFGARIVDGGLPSKGRNAGAVVAKTEYLLFLDADVELKDSEFFQKAWENFHGQEFDLATVDVDPKSEHWWDKFSHKFYNRYVRLWGAQHPHTPGFCIFSKSALHKKMGGFDEQIVFCEDHEYAHRAVKKHGAKFGFLKKEIAVPVSVRRMERDGRATIAVKYFLGEMHFLFLGPIRNEKF
ncbi:glycosyltransferase, partial [Patescibacteria group bacterium]|nr:glycosyltransferase [Patescibacteria group bacterium]